LSHNIIENNLSIIDAVHDPQLFQPWFRTSSWAVWFTFLKTLFALSFNESDAVAYRHHTGRELTPEQECREAWLVVGRRGGKSLISSAIGVYLACFRDHSAVLQPGEVGTIAIIAADRRQARTILRYIRAFLNIDVLNGIVVNDTQERIELRNNITIEVHTASFRTTRGYTLIAAILDEIAFFRSEDSANPDKEIVSAVRPGLATTGGLLLAISSPYARRGSLWEAYSRHWGRDSRVLIWKGTSLEMNPSLDPAVVEQALEEDEVAARAEYLGEFRTDTETFIRREVINAAVIPGRTDLPVNHRQRYRAFVDPSGGSSDSMTLAIAHQEGEKAVLDLAAEVKAPFSPDAVVREFSATLKRYGITKVTGDRYAGEWPRERFKVHGVEYQVSERSKGEIYLECLPLLNSQRVELLDSPRLVSQLLNLERRTSSGGRDIIDHPPNSHDDLINSAAGALLLVTDKPIDPWGGIF
jgi:hypothetical protein